MRGFTLIETLLYLGIFAIAVTGMLESFSSIEESISRTQTRALLSQEGNFLQQKISYELTNTENISPASFTISHGALFEQDSGSSEQLSSDDVQVTNMEFSSTQTEISFSFLISATSSDGRLLSRAFTGTSYLFP